MRYKIKKNTRRQETVNFIVCDHAYVRKNNMRQRKKSFRKDRIEYLNQCLLMAVGFSNLRMRKLYENSVTCHYLIPSCIFTYSSLK